MKHFLTLLFLTLCVSAYAQYPNAPNKIALGRQTTGDGLIFRGGDSISYNPTTAMNAWFYFDTVEYKLFFYDSGSWRLLADTTAGGNANLSFTPGTGTITLQSSTGTDVRFTAGSNIALTAAGDSMIISSTGGGTLDGEIKGDLLNTRVDTVQRIVFNLSHSLPDSVGKLAYNSGDYTLHFGMGLGNAVYQMGQELFYPPVINKSGVDIKNGQVVMIDTSLLVQGDKMRIIPAIGTMSSSNFILGVATHDIANDAEGLVTWFGYVREVDHANIAQTGVTLDVGDILYISSTEAGRYTDVEPAAPKVNSTIALVVRKPNENNMTLMVRPWLNEKIGDLTDVETKDAVNKSVLMYDSSTKVWNATTSPGLLLSDTSTIATKWYAADTASGVKDWVIAQGYNTGTVTSVATGYGLDGGTITTSGTLSVDTSEIATPYDVSLKQDLLSGTGLVKSTGGVISYVTDNSTNWNAAYNDRITSAGFTGTDTKTLTLTQQDAGTVTASFTDLQGVTSVATGVGLSGGTITTTGTISADTSILSTKWYAADTASGVRDWVVAQGYTSNAGTVTSIATNNGITGGTITSSGTIGLTGQALALHNLSTNGLIARTGAGTVAGRTITAGTGISVTNGDGVSANPTITNSAPDQVVSITGAGINSVTGTYPNFTITATEVDGSTTNELQTLSAVTNQITLSNSGGSVTIAGAGINTVGTAGSTITVTGTEVDGSISNEGQLTIDTNVFVQAIVLESNTTGSEDLAFKSGFGVSQTLGTYTGGKTINTEVDTTNIVSKTFLSNQGYTSNVGTVTSIATNNGITGGTITSSGTIGLTGQALALHNLSTNGLIARTGAGTVAGRTITAGTGISVTNGDGVSANPTITNSAPDQVVSITGAGINSVTGTYPNFTVTATEVDGSISNEGVLGVGAGAANTSIITSNTSGATGVTINGGVGTLITETTSSNGGTINILADTSGVLVSKSFLSNQGYTSNVGTVTSIATNNGITGGTITSSGTIGLTGQALGLHQLGTTGLVSRTSAGQIVSRIVTAGTGISVANGNGNLGDPTITNTLPEATTARNVNATGIGIYRDEIGNELQFKKLVAGSNVSITSADSTITITSTASGGGGGTVTDITAGYGLTGGTITISGTIAADTTNVLASKTWVETRGYLTNEVDGSVTNEGTLGVAAGSSTTAVITTNTSGANGVTINAGTGVGITETTSSNGGTITITNSAPDQTVSLTSGTGISTSGTYPNFTIANSAPDQTVSITGGTGISTSGTYPNFTITNSQPEATTARNINATGEGIFRAEVGDELQFKRLVAGSNITLTGADSTVTIAATNAGTVTSIATNNGITGGTITSSGTIGLTGQALALHNLSTNGLIARTGAGTVAGRTITGGTSISVTNGDGVSGDIIITNASPDQTVNLTSGTGISTSGDYPNFTITNSLPEATTARNINATGEGIYRAEVGNELQFKKLVAGSNITLTGADSTITIASTASGSIKGTGAANKVAIWASADSLYQNTNLHWDNGNGRLGIGSTSPATKLHLEASELYQLTLKNTANSGALKVGVSDSRFIFFEKPTGITPDANYLFSFGVLGGADSINPFWNGIQFGGHRIDKTAETAFPRLTIFSRSSSVWNPSDYEMVFGLGNMGTFPGGVSFRTHNNNANFLRFGTDSSPNNFYVKGDGNIGIGTNTPQNRLDVEGGAAIGATYSGTNTAPTNGLLVQGETIIGTTTDVGDYKLQVQGNAKIRGNISGTFPVTITGSTYTVEDSVNYIIANVTGLLTVTLPSPSTWQGREITFSTITANRIKSAGNNVVQIQGSLSPDSTIVPALDGSWAKLVSNGTNWVIMERSIMDESPRDTTLYTAVTAIRGEVTLVDATLLARTVTPPLNPRPGEWFSVSDARGVSATNNITVSFSTQSQNLYGTSQDYIINANGGYIKFMYVNDNTGWIATK